jgi:protocatechuate 3,4-dioxygenase beta subunit
MYRFLSLALCLALVATADAGAGEGFVRGADVNQYVDDVRVNIEDRRTVDLVFSFTRTDPDGTNRTLEVDRDLNLKATVWSFQGTREIRVDLMRSNGGSSQTLSRTNSQAFPGETTARNFSVCGARIIVVPGGTLPGRCADLLPLATPDPQVRPCEFGCYAPYEGMPKVITSHARIAPLSEPGEPLTISGRVFGSDGRPRAGIIVYAYHTNRLGIYPPPVPPRSQDSDSNGQLRGWARTDSEGRYTFDTIRPGSYPNTNNPQHVHMYVVEPGCAFYYINEMQFSDDPMLQKMNAEQKRNLLKYATVETPRRTQNSWEVTRDIHLGEGVPGYKPCPVAK